MEVRTGATRRMIAAAAALLAAAFVPRVLLGVEGIPFREYPIGEPVERDSEKMKIAAVWFPAVAMEGHDHPPGGEAIHLEADIHALPDNPNGFGAGDWYPYLTVNYKLVHLESNKEIAGRLQPMVAKDGPHYGATLEMPAKGKYRLEYEVRSPSENGFGRHADPVTGVAEWWKPYTVSWEFEYAGGPARP